MSLILKTFFLPLAFFKAQNPDQSIFEFLNEEFKRWDKEVFNSKKLLTLDELNILFQCLKIHADYLKTQLESESSEVFIPLSLVKIERVEGLTFHDVLEIILTNMTELGQTNDRIKEYVVTKIKYILFLASFDFMLTKKVFEVNISLLLILFIYLLIH